MKNAFILGLFFCVITVSGQKLEGRKAFQNSDYSQDSEIKIIYKDDSKNPFPYQKLFTTS